MKKRTEEAGVSFREMTDERLRAFAVFGYLTREQRIELFRQLLLIRRFEQAVVEERNRKDKPSDVIGPTFDSYGQESVAVGIASALRDIGGGIFYAPSQRSGAGRFILGLTFDDAWRQWFTSAEGPSRGRDLNWHLGSRDGRVLRFISHQGALCPMLTGAVDGANYLLEFKGEMNDETRVVGVIEFGDGTMAQPVVHSTMNAAAVLNIPVLFVVNDNRYAIATHPHESHPFDTPLSSAAVRGLAYAMPGFEATNGWDAEEVYYRARYAFERARLGYGPAFLVCKTFRFEGHNRQQPTKNLTEHAAWQMQRKYFGGRDPVDFLRFALRDALSDEEARKLEEEITGEVARTRERARAARKPKPTREDLGEPLSDPACAVTAELAIAHPPGKADRNLEYGRALNEAFHQAMAQDPRVRVFGEDVRSGYEQGATGGVYGITRGLTEAFGAKRCFSTPMSEDWIVGHAAGMAYAGCRPVAEIQFLPFLDVAWSQVNSIIATHYWHSGINLPLVIRVPCGTIPSSGHFHSQMLEAALANIPGLKIVFPADAFEAKGLLLSAIADPDPVIFLEQINAYYNADYTSSVPRKPYYLPLGKAQVRREGSDLTIVTYGALMVKCAEDAAEMLAEDGVSAEIVNLRTLVPFDRETILASYAKTGRALIVHEATMFAGFGAEIAALLAGPEGHARSKWRGADKPPIVRLGALDTPIPGNPALETFRLPSVEQIVADAETLIEYP